MAKYNKKRAQRSRMRLERMSARLKALEERAGMCPSKRLVDETDLARNVVLPAAGIDFVRHSECRAGPKNLVEVAKG